MLGEVNIWYHFLDGQIVEEINFDPYLLLVFLRCLASLSFAQNFSPLACAIFKTFGVEKMCTAKRKHRFVNVTVEINDYNKKSFFFLHKLPITSH